jgi:hypothetical protein
MFLIIIMLHREDFLEDILSGLVELGVDEAVAIDSEPMKKILAYKVPIFAGLKFDMREKPFSKLILALADDADVGKRLVDLLKGSGVNIEEPGVGRILTLKLESAFGEAEGLGDI